MKTKHLARIAALAAVLAVPTAGVSSALAAAKANETDRAFGREMVPHHQMATEMAAIAKTDGEHAKDPPPGQGDHHGAERGDPHDEADRQRPRRHARRDADERRDQRSADA